MTRKHFNALAEALRHSDPRKRFDYRDVGAAALSQWEADVRAVADVCSRFNPNFDRSRFMNAAGFKP